MRGRGNSQINGGSGTVTLRPSTLSRNINIESGSTAGVLSLTPTELATVTTTGTLEIGRSDGTGTLTVSTPIVAANVNAGTLRLFDKDIAFNAGVAVNGNLVLGATNNIVVQDATVDAGGAMDVIAGNNLSVTAVNVATALQSTGAQTINANGITIQGAASGQDLTAQLWSQSSQDITVGAGGISLIGGSGVSGNYSILGAGVNQTITINNGGIFSITGSDNGAFNYAEVLSGGAQSITFTAGGALNLKGGAGAGGDNSAGLGNAGTLTQAPQTITFNAGWCH